MERSGGTILSYFIKKKEKSVRQRKKTQVLNLILLLLRCNFGRFYFTFHLLIGKWVLGYSRRSQPTSRNLDLEIMQEERFTGKIQLINSVKETYSIEPVIKIHCNNLETVKYGTIKLLNSLYSSWPWLAIWSTESIKRNSRDPILNQINKILQG